MYFVLKTKNYILKVYLITDTLLLFPPPHPPRGEGSEQTNKPGDRKTRGQSLVTVIFSLSLFDKIKWKRGRLIFSLTIFLSGILN
jgi:hypothetical protein